MDHNHEHHHNHEVKEKYTFSDYIPLLIVFSYVFGGAVVLMFMGGSRDLRSLMGYFMGLFFIFFSLFKLVNLKEFAETYRSYDILAKNLPFWGYIYPFVELGLGVSYLLVKNLFVTNLATLVLMLVGALGVYMEIKRNRKFKCACLGAVINLPLSRVSLIEDLLMAAMALWMLLG